jgi:hypothetical protein
MNIIEELKNDAAGLKTLKDWVGEGLVPVHQDLSNQRALACVQGNDGKKCPHNRGGKWWEKFSKEPIALHMISQIERKNQIQVSTPYDQELEICDVCGCCLQLIVQTPIETIKRRTIPSTVENYPNFCWKRIELENS